MTPEQKNSTIVTLLGVIIMLSIGLYRSLDTTEALTQEVHTLTGQVAENNCDIYLREITSDGRSRVFGIANAVTGTIRANYYDHKSISKITCE